MSLNTIRCFIGLAICWFTGLPTHAQFLPVLDQNPTNLRWYQLKTPHFRVLYPPGLDSAAQRTARRLEQIYEPASASLGGRPRPISVLLQNQTTSSNGFVTLFPRRSEFFAVTPQDAGLLGTNDWLDLLAVHEYQHVVQFDKGLHGYGQVLYALLGNTGLGFARLTLPDWFMEGDAVSAETLMSTSGRGRIPNFDLALRANLLAVADAQQRPTNYAKAVCGSFLDNVPNHYVLGYHLTTFLKQQRGPDAWGRTLNLNFRRPPLPFAFSASVKEVSGLRTDDLYQKTMAELTEIWQKQRNRLSFTPARFFAVQPEAVRTGPGQRIRAETKRPVFTHYRYPQFLTDSTVLCVKEGLGDTPRLVVLGPSGREKQAFVQGFPNDPSLLSATAANACWIEFGFDPRWGQRIYSNIRLLDLATGKLRRLTHRARYTAVALSPDNQKLVVVENTANFQSRLVVLSAQTGQRLTTLPNTTNLVYQHPRWHNDSRTIVTVALGNNKKTIQLVDSQTFDTKELVPPTNENISHPQPWGNYVLYDSPRSGIDNIYAVNTATKEVFQVTSRPLAAYHAAVSPSGGRLAFEDFAATGYRIADMPLNPADWKRVPGSTAPAEPIRYFGPRPEGLRPETSLAQREPGAADVRPLLADSTVANSLYKPGRFGRLAHALNVYSWGPVIGSTGQELTVGLNSQDLLSTTQVGVGYSYSQAERVGAYFANLSYQGLYPIFDLSFRRGDRNTSLYVDRVAPRDSLRTDRWQYNQLTAGVRLPLRLTQSKYAQNMNVSAYYNYLQVSGYDLPLRFVTEVGSAGSLSAMTYGFGYSRLLRQSKRDVGPRWGQTLSASYRTTPFGGRLRGDQWSVQAGVYLPGFGPHHSLRLRGGYQQQAPQTYQFGPAVFYPRGQTYVGNDRIKTGSAEYRLPLADMHWSPGRLLYVQRIKAGAFFDGAIGQNLNDGRSQHYRTTGLEVSFVFNVLRLRTSFELGVRTIYNIRTNQWLVQPLVLDIGF